VVKIYGSDSCFHCLKCKQMCEAMQIEHEYLDVGVRDVALEFKRLFPDAEGIPQIIWNDKHIGGYVALTSEINHLLNNGENND
jgi:glutaredoxin